MQHGGVHFVGGACRIPEIQASAQSAETIETIAACL
jgi:hypothetical protein